MGKIDYDQLLKDCLDITRNHLQNAYNSAKPFAEHSIKQFAEDAVFLANLNRIGEIDDNEFKHRMENQKLALANVFLAVKGIGLVEAQNVVNSVLGLISKAILGGLNIALPI